MNTSPLVVVRSHSERNSQYKNPDEVIEEMKKSGLTGRGGASFSTGMKWDFARKAPGDVKYIICNADEGEPGTFKDRLILEGDPHKLIEGMLIAGFAVGAHIAVLYIYGVSTPCPFSASKLPLPMPGPTVSWESIYLTATSVSI